MKKDEMIASMKEKIDKKIYSLDIEDIKTTALYSIIDELLSYEFLVDIKSMNEIEKLRIYKMFNGNIDCDVSLRSIIIAKQAYSYLYDYEIMPQFNGGYSPYKFCLKSKEKDKVIEYRADTMTSAFTTFKEFIRNESLDDSSIPKPWIGCNNRDYWLYYVSDRINKGEKLPNEMNAFLRLNHTIGNIIPVPCNFNKARSSNPLNNENDKNKRNRRNAEWDYWDLTLWAIYCWFENNGLKNILRTTNEKIFKKNEDKIKKRWENIFKMPTVEVWLKSFGQEREGWNQFVSQNYFQNYIEEDGKPSMFWENHSFANPLPPKTLDIKQILREINDRICFRSNAISQSFHNKNFEK
ncbi:hypothetical protein J2Z42_000574 [Clostridium algifaecis]|uniref:Uncharacterized protein n=1 Tax=Clostridium algifaecis TaxID=1472040 RepID=A0ABS4KPE4_9CLOT|nr:hypothetical protein [Clostridium algifaecis]MBP2031909.1 hypothetical protein [Clostridium algifaecis]